MLLITIRFGKIYISCVVSTLFKDIISEVLSLLFESHTLILDIMLLVVLFPSVIRHPGPGTMEKLLIFLSNGKTVTTSYWQPLILKLARYNQPISNKLGCGLTIQLVYHHNKISPNDGIAIALSW